MNQAQHQRGQPSVSSVRSFDEANEHATDYISGMYQDINHHTSSSPPSRRPVGTSSTSTMGPPNGYPAPLRRKDVRTPGAATRVPRPPVQPVQSVSTTSDTSRSNSSIQSTPEGSTYQRSPSSGSSSSSSSEREKKSPTLNRPRLRQPSPPPQLPTAQLPLSGLEGDDDGSSPSSPDEIAKELSNLQAFKRMSLDASNLVSDPDLPSNNRVSIPNVTALAQAGLDEDAARLLWVPAHLHPEIAANDDWKDFVQRRVEETKATGAISRVKSISGGPTRGLSRSKSILSRQIDASDEESWSHYSDAGHKELERRASRNQGQPTERHMITVAELEKLEALIKEGALERQGRPISGEGIESLEASPTITPEVPAIGGETPLMPSKGTLKRSAHTSMRNARRGAMAARSARRASEPKKELSRISTSSIPEEDGRKSPADLDLQMAMPSPSRERSESLPGLKLERIPSELETPLQLEIDKSRISAPAVLGKLDLQGLPPTIPEIHTSPEPLLPTDEPIVLGQVQPRQLRRPPLRRLTVEAPEALQPPLLSPVKELPPIELPPKDLPPKDILPERPPKKSPVSPLSPTPPLPSPKSPVESITPRLVSPTFPPQPSSLQAPLPPPPPSEPAVQPQSKKGPWSRLFTSSSEDEQPKEKPLNKLKPKRSPTFPDPSKQTEFRSELPGPVESIERKPLPAPVVEAAKPIIAATAPTPSPPPPSQKPVSKKESGLFSSLFGSKKKSESKDQKSKAQDNAASTQSGTQDRSQYQRHGPGGWSVQSTAVGPPVINFYYTRFPIHVERAIYRLSHIKLANPRRPLLQQVLLSNFMYGYLNLINKTAAQTSVQQQEQMQQQQPVHEAYVQQSQNEDHVFYSSDDQPDYYGEDYYGAEYDDDGDDTIPQGHDMDFGYGNTGYQQPTPVSGSSAQGPSQSPSYNKRLPQTYEHQQQPNGRRHEEPEDEIPPPSTFILRDSKGRTLSLPKSGVSLGNSWAGGLQDEPSHSGNTTGKRYH